MPQLPPLPPGALVLVDSSALVYLVEGETSSARRSTVEAFFTEAQARSWRLSASVVAWAELLELPLARNDAVLADRYRRLLSGGRLELLVVDVAVAERAALLSASLAPGLRRSLSTADLIHIATASIAGANAVLGNDESWRAVQLCPPLLLVDELAFDSATKLSAES